MRSIHFCGISRIPRGRDKRDLSGKPGYMHVAYVYPELLRAPNSKSRTRSDPQWGGVGGGGVFLGQPQSQKNHWPPGF
jgi:hypothetical protein